MAKIEDIPEGTTVYHVASPNFAGVTTGKVETFKNHGFHKNKVMVLVRYKDRHPKFGRNEVYCDPELLYKTTEEAQAHHIPEEVYNSLANIIES